MISKTILNYTIIKQLDAGGMGSVFLAKHALLGHQVVVKILLDKHLLNANVVNRFVQEAQILTRLNHPNIVRLVNFTEDPVYGYVILMDYVVGKTLEEYRNTFRNRQLPLDVTLQLMSELLDAFAYAHAQGVVHRDIKPNNIFITPEGKPILLDFGISKLKNSDLTQDSQFMGTPLYMSPEQLNAPREVDLRSDIYTLGVILYELLTGEIPYKDISSQYALMKEILITPLPKITSIRTDLPTKLDTVLAKATAKNKADRYENTTLFKRDLMNVGEKEEDTPPDTVPEPTTPIDPEIVKARIKKLIVSILQISFFVGCVGAALNYKEIGDYFKERKRNQFLIDSKRADAFFKNGNYTEAFLLYNKHKDEYNEDDKVYVYNKLGWMYFSGKGTSKNQAIADSYFQKAENEFNAAELLEFGKDCSGDPNVADPSLKDDNLKIYWYKKAAAKGDSTAPLLLGNVYITGEGVPKNEKEAFKWYEIVEKNMNGAELLELGKRFKDGDSRYFKKTLVKYPQDDNMKIYWYQKAAAKGDTSAPLLLGNAYYNGEGIPKNEKNAFQWYQKAAEYNSTAQFMSGWMYYKGIGILQDDKMSAYWFRKAADNNNSDGQVLIGYMYDCGKGVPADSAEAFKWYYSSAVQGNALGALFIGNMYERGKYVAKNDTIAVQWYQKSVKKGNDKGQIQLAKIYEKGKGGLPKDIYKAVELYQSAAKQGNADAKNRLRQLGYKE